MRRRWWRRCSWVGHDWMGVGPFEHICFIDNCWRCREKRWVHLTGPWPHTCGSDSEEVRGDA
jgi:hypothetical protein